MRVLVVDDSRAMRMIIVRELRRVGVVPECIREAADGQVALELLRQEPFDVVLSDWNMPVMDGLALLEAARADGIDVPFGFVTSEAAEAAHLRGFEAGAAFVVTKPFDATDLGRALEAAVGDELIEDADAWAEDEGGTGDVGALLSGLLRRPVVTVPAAGDPRRDRPRAVARYVAADGRPAAVCVVELGLAAAAGAALSLLPAHSAAEWARAGALPEALAQNFHEVANVLSQLVGQPRGRCRLEEVDIVADYEDLPEERMLAAAERHAQLEVTISGYEPGRLALFGLP